MDAYQAILSRRSIRKFTDRRVDEDTVEKILNAAMSAPSAGNEQPWHFIVIRDREILDEITRIHPYSRMLIEVSLAILVCGDINLEHYEGFWVQDCAAATENMLVAINSLGLGSVWLGVYPVEERVINFRKLFGAPEHVYPFSLLPVGYPAETKPAAARFDVSRIRYERWDIGKR